MPTVVDSGSDTEVSDDASHDEPGQTDQMQFDLDIGNLSCVICKWVWLHFASVLMTGVVMSSELIDFYTVWFKLTVTEMTVNGNKSNPLTVTEKFY